MAIRAGLGRRFVEQHQFPLYLALQRVALLALHIFVAAGKGKLRAFIVIEGGRSPSLRRVAISARGYACFGSDKLSGMRIHMAGFAILGRALELNTVRSGNRFVTIAASHRAMRSH